MSISFFPFFSPLLLLTVGPAEQDFSDVAECAANESEIQSLQFLRAIGSIATVELKQKQEAGTISEDENIALLLVEMRLHELSIALSLREHIRYYCIHPERRPKPVVEPRTIA